MPAASNTITVYLLGLSPMPPPSPQDLAVAALYTQMNNPTGNAGEDADFTHILENEVGNSQGDITRKCTHLLHIHWTAETN